MKISAVTAYHLPGTRYPWVFLRVDTDQGIHGVGQVSSGPNSPVLEQKLADYSMPDVIRTGGISELKKIATMAEAFFIPVSPHDATGPITLIAGAQVMMTTPNF